MGQVILLSLLLGSLGLQALFAGTLLGWQQNHDHYLSEAEEEEAFTIYDTQDSIEPMDEPPLAKPTSARKAAPGSAQTDPRLVGWEYKIVRASSDLFRDPKILKTLCDEEAGAGWILLEKLDDRRIRFKRPIAMRQVLRADLLPIDPYRSVYGKSWEWRWIGIGMVGIALLVLPAYLGFALVSSALRQSAIAPSNPSNPPTSEQP